MNINVDNVLIGSPFDGDKLFFLSDISNFVKKQIDEIVKNSSSLNDVQTKQLNTKKLILEGELKEIKILEELFEIFYEFGEKMYSQSLERLPSLFVENRKTTEKLEFLPEKVRLALDCNDDGVFCFDHHFIDSSEDKVATNIVIDFIKKNPRYSSLISRLFKSADAPQILAEFKKYLKNRKKGEFKKFMNYFIPYTKGHIDTDAILTHFSLIFPKKAIRYEKILTEAAMRGDLNLEVSGKAKRLNGIIMGIYVYFDKIKAQYKKYINMQYPDNNDLTEKLIMYFDTFMGNSIVLMVPKMLKFLDEKSIENKKDDKYCKFFSRAQNTYSDIVDSKVEDIDKFNKNYKKFLTTNMNKKDKINALEQDGLMKIKVLGRVISFIHNKNIRMDFNGIPPSSFYKYAKINENIDSGNLKYNIICTIKCMDEESMEKSKYISISNIANNLGDLKKYSLKSKLADINRLELSNLKNLLEKKNKELNSLNGQNGKKFKSKQKSLLQEIECLENKISLGKRKGLFNYRNGLIFCSSSYSSLSDIVNILNKD